MGNLEQAARQALKWAEAHGEIVFATGGMSATDAMTAWATAIRAALQPAAPAVPDGWKLVPVEPNIGMTQAALYVSRSYAEHDAPLLRCHELNDAALVYRAMLAAAPPILEDLKELFKKSGKPKVLTGPCGQCGDTKHPCFCSTVDVPFEDSSPTVTSHRQPLPTEQYTQLAHRIASRYSHRSDPQFIAYTFLPHTLEQFVRAIEAAISNQ